MTVTPRETFRGLSPRLCVAGDTAVLAVRAAAASWWRRPGLRASSLSFLLCSRLPPPAARCFPHPHTRSLPEREAARPRRSSPKEASSLRRCSDKLIWASKPRFPRRRIERGNSLERPDPLNRPPRTREKPAFSIRPGGTS